MKKLTLFGLIAFAALTLTGCADKIDVTTCIPMDEPAGFWHGVWHGSIMWFSFIGSLFDNTIAIYAVNNDGGWYNFGFVGGFGIIIRLIAAFIKGLFGK